MPHNPTRPPGPLDPTRTAADPASGLATGSAGNTPSASAAPGVPLAAPADAPAFPFLAPPQAADEFGRLGRYRVLGVLGQGGMGVVFRAEDTMLRRQVALKVMLPHLAANALARERFLREARAAARVEHDHVVPVYNADEDRGTVFLAMPLLKGMTLAAALKLAPRPPVFEVLRVGRETADGLAAAHDQRLVHRDIKPANVWLEGDRRRVKILDFGLARAAAEQAGDADEPLTASGAVVGTPQYMSPEQASGEAVDHRTDLFSLGVILYEMATGRRPFAGPNTMAVLSALALHHPPPPAAVAPDCPPALSALVLRLLSKDPGSRPPSAQAVSDELARIEQSLSQSVAVPLAAAAPSGPDPWADIDATDPGPVAAPPLAPAADGRAGGVSPPSAPAPRKPVLLWAAGGLAVAAVAAVAAVLMVGGKPSGEQAKTTEAAATRKSGPPPATGKGTSPKPDAVQPPAVTPTPGAIDLLALVDPARDTVKGTWERKGGDLVGSRGQDDIGVIEAPYRPADEYDYTAEFTTAQPGGQANLALARGGRAFKWSLGVGPAADRFGFNTINGKTTVYDPSSLRPDLKMEPGRRYTTRVEVRKDRLTAYLGTDKVAELKTDYSNLGTTPQTRLRDDALLGLAVHTPVTFHRLEVTEVTGRGTFTRGGPPVSPTAGAPLFNGKDLTGWDGDPKAWRVENGAIVGTQGDKPTQLASMRAYRDFELSLEARVTGQGRLTVGGRGTRETPKGYINEVLGIKVSAAGNVFLEARGLPGGGTPTGVKPGEFVPVTLRVVGRRMTATASGVPLLDADVEAADEGLILLALAGNAEATVRNIRFTDLSAGGGKAEPPNK